MQGQGAALSAEERRQGFIVHYLIGSWDRWVKRRTEKIELVTDSRVRRRISVDFRLHHEIFGEPPVRWGPDPIHYVPLTMLEKAPFMHFDLRDEQGAALPLITRQKSASIAAAALSTAAKTLVIRHFLMASAAGMLSNETPILKAIKSADLRLDKIKIPESVEHDLFELCYQPFTRESHEADSPSASQIRLGMLDDAARAASPKLQSEVVKWEWKLKNDEWSAPGQDRDTWIPALFSDDIFSELAFDFARLFLVCAPVKYEKGRRRVLKFQYEENVVEPGMDIWTRARKRNPGFARWLRQREDKGEGLKWEPDIAKREWILPESTSNRQLRHPSVLTKLGRGIGWRSKLLTFELPGMGFGGTFHLEFAAPEGTQLRRARLRSARVNSVGTGTTGQGREEFARRYARNVSRCHLYLGRLRPGSWGKAVVAIKPSSATIVRGAALSSMVTTGLVMYALFAGSDLQPGSETVVALLLLAPGLLSAQLARPNEHPVTTGMLFGLRLLTLSVAGVAVITAALLGAHQAPCDLPVLWGVVVSLAIVLTVLLTRAWRLAGRDWPMRREV